ncbi:MAG: hypothetical protein SGJ24_15845 [Chloroflexota bacterium]|nr:hypothetical protein [Chloroflexota bacterium]
MAINTTRSLASTPKAPARNQHYIAWGVILVAFSAFCVVGALSLVGGHHFIFRSTIPIFGQLQVSRGTASLLGSEQIEQAVRAERAIEVSSVITTDSQSQATLTFQDPYHDGASIATVTLKNGASLVARQFSRPRFEWSAAPYQIVLDNIVGEFSIVVPADAPRPVTVQIGEPHGVAARLDGVGRYTVNANDTQLSVVNVSGEATMLANDGRAYPIPLGQQGTAQVTDPSRFMYAPALVNLLGNAEFSESNVLDFNAAPDQVRALQWRCNSWQNSLPAGGYSFVNIDGQPALRLLRGGGAKSHGETLCVQAFNATEGLDVSPFRHISLRVRFKISDHSLSACGMDGSECPLMVRMEYYPTGSDEIATWIHGFYAKTYGDLDLPVQCDSCGELHEVINTDRWYTYESGNLLTKLTPDKRPGSILNLKFYSSGHQYDVSVREVELLVDQAAMPMITAGNP